MLNFLRPTPDSTLRIMIPENSSLGSQLSSGPEESACEDDPTMAASSSNAKKIYGTNFSSNNSGVPPANSNLRVQRQYKAYTVMQRSGFQHTEYVQIITHLCKAEVFISTIFLVHGLSCPGFPNESSYQGTCHINVLAALVGIFTGGMGLGAVNRFRWKTMLVMWLIMCIISSVANLLAVITTGVWLDHLSKLKTRTGIANGLSGMMLLGSVLVGVCFILTAVLICHYWASNSTKYQAVGRIAKKNRSLRRRTSRANSAGNATPGGGNNGERSRLTSGGSGYNSATGRHFHHSPLVSTNHSNNCYDNIFYNNNTLENNNTTEGLSAQKRYEIV